jgi:hypothetical protein
MKAPRGFGSDQTGNLSFDMFGLVLLLWERVTTTSGSLKVLKKDLMCYGKP